MGATRRVTCRIRFVRSSSLNGGACGLKRANFLNCMVVRQKNKKGGRWGIAFLVFPTCAAADAGGPFWYSNTVMLANPTYFFEVKRRSNGARATQTQSRAENSRKD